MVKKSEGGLFYDVEVDPENPGYYNTFIQMWRARAKTPSPIKADRMFAETTRCQV